jgi:hypothetical protein
MQEEEEIIWMINSYSKDFVFIGRINYTVKIDEGKILLEDCFIHNTIIASKEPSKRYRFVFSKQVLLRQVDIQHIIKVPIEYYNELKKDTLDIGELII